MDISPWSSKNLIDRNRLKKYMQVDLACAPILVGMGLPVLEIPVLSKTAKFSSRTMDYSPWSSKYLIDQNQLKRFMQVGLDVTCMFIDFGGCSLSTFGDNITSQKWPNFPFGPWTIHGHQKI